MGKKSKEHEGKEHGACKDAYAAGKNAGMAELAKAERIHAYKSGKKSMHGDHEMPCEEMMEKKHEMMGTLLKFVLEIPQEQRERFKTMLADLSVAVENDDEEEMKLAFGELGTILNHARPEVKAKIKTVLGKLKTMQESQARIKEWK